MKSVGMRIPALGAFGETRLLAKDRAIVPALLVKSPRGGCVESVFTRRTQFLALGVVRRFKRAPVIDMMAALKKSLASRSKSEAETKKLQAKPRKVAVKVKKAS